MSLKCCCTFDVPQAIFKRTATPILPATFGIGPTRHFSERSFAVFSTIRSSAELARESDATVNELSRRVDCPDVLFASWKTDRGHELRKRRSRFEIGSRSWLGESKNTRQADLQRDHLLNTFAVALKLAQPRVSFRLKFVKALN